MPEPTVEEVIRGLPEDEATVLYLKCRGVAYKAISERVKKSVVTVTYYMASVYHKLALDFIDPKTGKSLHKSLREPILEEMICPVIQKIVGNKTSELMKFPLGKSVIKEDYSEWVKFIEGLRGVKEAPIIEPQKVIEPPPPPRPPELLPILYNAWLMALEDVETDPSPRPEIEEKKDKVIKIPPRNPPIRAIVVLLLIALCLAAASGVGGYYYGVRQIMTPVVVITVVQPVTEIMPTPIPSDTPVPTFTFTPLPTLSPTTPPTITASPTEFVPPADGILFEDNFDSGDLSAWQQVSGEWIVSNGQLTVLPSESDSYRWIALVRPEWRNYILSVTVYQPFQGSAAQEDVLVTVRNNTSQANYLGVPADYFGNVYWAFIGEGYFDKEPIAGENGDFDFETGSNMELEVLGDTYTLRINGREIQKITMSGYNSGGISLGTECNRSPCGSFDNLKVTYLP